MLVVVTATMLVVDVLGHILVGTGPGCTILDHTLVATGPLDHSPTVDAHHCRRCTLQLDSSLRCGLVAYICNMCRFFLIFLFLSC